MNRRHIWVVAFLFFLIVTFPAAAEIVTLTLEDAVARALDQSINLKKSSIDLVLADYAARNLWAQIFPGFSLSAGLNFLPSAPLFTDPGFSYNGDALAYSLNFGISLSLNPAASATMKSIDLAYRSQLLSYDDARNQLEIQVIKNFLNLITMKENISNMEENLRLAQQQMQKDRVARENGLLSELDWLNSRLGVETALYDLNSAQGNYQNSLETFLALLGMNTGTDIIFKGTVDIVPVQYDPEMLIREYLPKRPDVMLQRQTIEKLQLAKNVTTFTNRSPSLDLGAQWLGGSPSNNTGGLGAPFSDRVAGTLTVRVPIDSWIPGTKQNQTIKSANADVEKAVLDLQNTEIQAKTQIRSLILNLNNTWESLEIAHLRVEIAHRTADAAMEGFQHGTVENQELDTIRRDLSIAEWQLLQREYSYQSMLLDLAAALNVDWRTLTGQKTAEDPEPDTSSGISSGSMP